MFTVHVLALSLALHLQTSSGFSFTINNTPQQCSDLSISVVGSGQPPYSAVVVPYGSTPIPNDIDVRNVLDIPFSDSTSTSFKLTYPGDSQFVVVVSDSTGFGTGGASVATQVQTGSDFSCYNNDTSAKPPFTFSTNPDNELTQCTSTRIFWDYGTTQGNVQFYGVIPGGQCFPINEETPSTAVIGEGYGFNSTAPVRAGTTVLLVGGDGRGIGTGGWEQMVIKPSDNQSCLNSLSPSSTPGTPAGAAYPTSSSGGSSSVDNNNGSPSSTSGISSKSNKNVNKDAIIGGAAGGGLIVIAIIVLVFLCFLRRTRRTRNDNPVNLLEDNGEPLSPGQIPQFYQREAFRAPDMTTAFSRGRSSEASTTHSLSYGMQSYNSQKSMQTRSTFPQHPGTPEVD